MDLVYWLTKPLSRNTFGISENETKRKQTNGSDSKGIFTTSQSLGEAVTVVTDEVVANLLEFCDWERNSSNL